MRQTRPTYAGRPPSPSPATGLYQQHVREQTGLVEAALAGGPVEAIGTA
jgi:2-oxoglutarate dehydrogenase E1 component